MKFASVSEDHPIMNLWKVGSDKCCSFHFLVHHSEWPILRFRLYRKSQNHAMNSMLRTQGLGIECETYQQKCNYHACCQLPDWRTLDVTSCVLLIHSKPRRDKKGSALIGPIFGKLSLSRIKGENGQPWYPLIAGISHCVAIYLCNTSIPVRLPPQSRFLVSF